MTITFGEGKEVCYNDKYESFPTRKAFFLNKQNKMSTKKIDRRVLKCERFMKAQNNGNNQFK